MFHLILYKSSSQETNEKIVDPRYFVAGGACAAISHGLATPFDVVKTKIQAYPEVSHEVLFYRSNNDTSNGYYLINHYRFMTKD